MYVVIIALTEVFDGTVPSKNIFPFPWDPYLKTDGTSLLILFLVKNFEEKEIQFLKKRFCQKLSSNDDNNQAFIWVSSRIQQDHVIVDRQHSMFNK